MTPRKPIIYGPDGHPIVRARDRLAPKPHAHAGVEGWVSWRLVDRQGRAVSGGEQHNLILDTFLDRMAASRVNNLDQFLTHFAVGTGSTEPDVTDTGLVNEAARTTVQTAYSTPSPADGVHVRILEREFDFGVGNGNLTEFGFSYGSASPLVVRELFRDEAGNPITITKTSEYKLRIRYTLTITLTPTAEEAHGFTIDGIGPITGTQGFKVGGYGGPWDIIMFTHVCVGSAQTNITNFGLLAALTSSVYSGYAATFTVTDPALAADTLQASSYTAGTHQRSIATARWSTARGNMSGVRSIVAFAGGNNTSLWRGGWAFSIAVADAFTKDNLHSLELNDMLTVSWARA